MTFLIKLYLTQREKNYASNIVSYIAGVVDTAKKHPFAIISANFRKNLKRSCAADAAF
jgi:hypothetical protein